MANETRNTNKALRSSPYTEEKLNKNNQDMYCVDDTNYKNNNSSNGIVDKTANVLSSAKDDVKSFIHDVEKKADDTWNSLTDKSSQALQATKSKVSNYVDEAEKRKDQMYNTTNREMNTYSKQGWLS
uniref:Uncharacterized protein n=2 Tax=Lygus hesperus TaxID=30085 RepID=A0A146LFM2_LYGHE